MKKVVLRQVGEIDNKLKKLSNSNWCCGENPGQGTKEQWRCVAVLVRMVTKGLWEEAKLEQR